MRSTDLALSIMMVTMSQNGLQSWSDLQRLTHSLIYLVGLVSSLESIQNGDGLGKGLKESSHYAVDDL